MALLTKNKKGKYTQQRSRCVMEQQLLGALVEGFGRKGRRLDQKQPGSPQRWPWGSRRKLWTPALWGPPALAEAMGDGRGASWSTRISPVMEQGPHSRGGESTHVHGINITSWQVRINKPNGEAWLVCKKAEAVRAGDLCLPGLQERHPGVSLGRALRKGCLQRKWPSRAALKGSEEPGQAEKVVRNQGQCKWLEKPKLCIVGLTEPGLLWDERACVYLPAWMLQRALLS